MEAPLASRQASQVLLLSSGALLDVRPDSAFVAKGAGLHAAVQDADPPVRELSERGLVAGAAGSELLVVGPGAGGAAHR